MKVIGFDPQVTVQSAWKLSSEVQQASNVDELLARADMVTLHVPEVEGTRNLINAERLKSMKKGVVILNFARAGIVNSEAVVDAIKSGTVHSYVCDFPANALKNHPRVIALPHLGASTREAEENCAVMVADQVRDFLENGNIINSVNFPEVVMSRTEGYRVAIANSNVPNMVGQISTVMANAGLNIVDMINKSRGEIAYTMADVDKEIPRQVVDDIASIKGVLSVRVLDN
jgi:D-3-phosphoglycerate dehydrogenase